MANYQRLHQHPVVVLLKNLNGDACLLDKFSADSCGKFDQFRKMYTSLLLQLMVE